MRLGFALSLGLGLATWVGCESPRAPLLGLTGGSSGASSSSGATASGGTGAGTVTGSGTGSASSTGGATGAGSTSGGTTGATRFSCQLGDGGLFGPVTTLDAGVGPNYVLASESGGHPISLGDANDDGFLDILIADYLSGDVGLLLGNGDGTFQTTRHTQLDENVDTLLIAGLGKPSQGASVISAQGSFTVQLDFLQIDQLNVENLFPSLDRFASTLAVADLNGDGWPDLLAAGTDVAVYLGGPGGFTALPSVSAWANLPTALADFNGDGILDLVGMSGDNLELFLGNGDGTFGPGQPISAGSAPCVVGDLNEDGHPDLLCAVAGTEGYVELMGTETGTFTTGAMLSVDCVNQFICDRPAYLVDLNGDGHLDLVDETLLPTTGTWVLKVAYGNGDGSFQAGTVYPSIAPVTFAFGDVNGDGRPDLIGTRVKDGNVDIWLNDCR